MVLKPMVLRSPHLEETSMSLPQYQPPRVLISSLACVVPSSGVHARWGRRRTSCDEFFCFFPTCPGEGCSPPARWGLLDFMSVAWSSSSSRCPPRPPAQLRLAIHSVLCRTSTTTIHAQCSLPDLNHDHPRPVFPAGPQPRPSTPSVPCRTSTTTITAQCSLPGLNHDHPRPVFPAGPQPRVSPPSVPCRTSTTTIHAQCSLPDLNREYPRQKICHIECQKICQIEC